MSWAVAAVVSAAGAALATPVLRRVTHKQSALTRGWWHVPLAALLGACAGLGAQSAPVGGLLSVLAVAGALLVVVDLAELRLPDTVLLPAAAVWLLGTALLAGFSGDWGSFLRALAGGAACFGVFLVAALASPAGLGFGDVKLAGVCGLVLAWSGWGALVSGLAAAVVLNGLSAAIVLLVTRDRTAAVPMGPWLILGVVVGNAVAPLVPWAG